MRNTLTKEQRRQAERAMYGLPQDVMDIQGLDIATVEALLNELKARQGNSRVVNEFDLNKPPTKPYVYQPFPKRIYHWEAGKEKNVANQAELEAHLAKGWRTDSPDPVPDAEDPDVAPALDPATQREVIALDKALKRKPKE